VKKEKKKEKKKAKKEDEKEKKEKKGDVEAKLGAAIEKIINDASKEDLEKLNLGSVKKTLARAFGADVIAAETKVPTTPPFLTYFYEVRF